MRPSDTEIIAVNEMALSIPADSASFDMMAMPTIDVDCDTVSAAVAGLNRPAMACTTMPMYRKPPWIACRGVSVTCTTSPVSAKR